ncbi:DUF3152 domain-containing protein [Streptomyces pimonensis]|uniref:DUF3152 domain-containing protein n=1 Tax=Streptomyces pimonensis TaxID=2860288 RepID=A0ABV4ISW9_9ACTN
MGRHSRRGSAPKGGTAGRSAVPDDRPAPDGSSGTGQTDRSRTPGPPPQQGPAGGPRGDGTPPAYGTAGHGTPADGVPGPPDGTPVHGVPRLPDGWLPDGTAAHGVPRLPDGTPAHGFPGLPGGTPAHGVPRARGGHPEQREPGGGWGALDGRTAAGTGTPTGPDASLPRQRQTPPGGPRQDYLDAFGEGTDHFSRPASVPVPRPPGPADSRAAVTDWSAAPVTGVPAGLDDDDAPPTGKPTPARGGKGRAFTGIAAAVVATVLAVVVAGQVADERDGTGVQAQAADEQARDVRAPASRGDERETPSVPGAEPLTYEQKMERTYPLSAARGGTGKFTAVPGIDKAPGKGQKFTYRVDVEQGLGLDGELFAEAVQRTLNDDRSWAHNGARTFERIHSGEADFVITLAGPDTTADWCAKSGLDTTVDNVSCDSAATERVMINADRWAQGADTYGDEIHAYRQMLINHEIGHRLGFNHVTCDKDGDLAPVMQQQTKFLDHDGISCRPNAWPYPKS